MKIFIKALNGCVMRRQKIEQYKKFLIDNWYEIVDSPNKSSIIIVWGCSFRSDWRDNSLAVINYYVDNFESQYIVVAGCLPSIAPEYIKKNPRVKIIPWKNDDVMFNDLFSATRELSLYNEVFAEKRICKNAALFRKRHPGADVTFHDQFIKVVIAIGCSFKCSYCSERLAFPKHKSFPEKEIIKKCCDIIDETAVYDVMLMADNLGQYGANIGSNLPNLMYKLIKEQPKIKFALNNFNPIYFLKFKESMESFIKEGDIKHLNLPIQSASDKILKLMNRPYKVKDLNKIFDTLKELNFKDFDTHIIVGFPGETDDDVEKTLKFLLRIKPRYILASRYMGANNAPSSSLPNEVDDVTACNRIKRISNVLNGASILFNTDGSTLSMERLKKLRGIK